MAAKLNRLLIFRDKFALRCQEMVTFWSFFIMSSWSLCLCIGKDLLAKSLVYSYTNPVVLAEFSWHSWIYLILLAKEVIKSLCICLSWFWNLLWKMQGFVMQWGWYCGRVLLCEGIVFLCYCMQQKYLCQMFVNDKNSSKTKVCCDSMH